MQMYSNQKTLSLKENYLKNPESKKVANVVVYLIAAMLISLPLKYAFGSVASIVFILASFIYIFKSEIKLNRALFLPIVLYLLMVVSLLWTRDIQTSVMALKKESLVFLLPIAFLYIPKLRKNQIDKIFSVYSFTMIGFSIYYLINAVYRYFLTHNTKVFFYHELVTYDLNAIYFSTFASFAFFYFLGKENKVPLDRIASAVLLLIIVLLSSKTILFIDFILIIFYYVYFLDAHRGIKTITVIGASSFLLLSLIFVNQSRERLIQKSQTLLVDNSVDNQKIIPQNHKIKYVSVSEAWHKHQFENDSFMPGAALRVFQTRIFFEMLTEQNILFSGFGIDASQKYIKEKCTQYKLTEGYGEFNFHNQYIQTFAELGVFGFLLLLFILYTNIKNAKRNKSFLHIVFSITMIMLFLSESFLSRQRGVIFFITLYCLFNSVEVEEQENNNNI